MAKKNVNMVCMGNTPLSLLKTLGKLQVSYDGRMRPTERHALNFQALLNLDYQMGGEVK